MHNLSLPRRLVEQQAFELLYEHCVNAQTPAEQVLLALACAALGDADAARLNLARLDGAALDIDARVDLAAVHLLLGDVGAAEQLLLAARPQAPEAALLLARLAVCRARQGESQEALALYQQSLALQPRIALYPQLLHLQLQAGQVLEAAASLAQAQAFWRQEQTHWPDAARARYSQQLCGLQLDIWLAQADFASADAWLQAQQAQLHEDDWCSLLTGYAQRLAERDQHAQAEDLLRRGLQHYPQQQRLLEYLAELAALQGRLPQAIALLRRAIRLAGQQQPATLALRLKLACHATQAHPGLARDMAQQALAEANSLPAGDNAKRLYQAQAEVALAAVETQQQQHAEAEARYRQVLDAHPQLLVALQGLGQLYMQLGRIDEAVALFEQVKALDPARGHAALINARRFPDDEATLQRLETLARQPGPEGSLHAGLLLQLAAAWEKRGDYAKAFALADAANAASRKRLRYDPAAHRQQCARIRHAFSASLYRQRQRYGLGSRLPVFVLGMPRSGTTLVEQILAGHSRIHGAGELGSIPRVIAGLERWERHTGSGRHYPDCVDDLTPEVTAGIARALLDELQEYAPTASHVVDKLPHNFENIGLIKLLFPNARIISVRRDPRDIALSSYFTDFAAKHGGMGFAYDLGWIGEQLADHNLLLHHWHQLFPGEILEVHYEDLLANPETQARRMLDHVGVDWEPQVLDFSELQRPVKTASVWQVRQPLYQTSMARWMRYQKYLAPLIAATNARIKWQPITDMLTLPEPGLLHAGVALYQAGQLDEAEYRFKQLLHLVPQHAAASFMVGLIYVRKGHLQDGIALMEQAHQRCPWRAGWRSDLAQAHELAGEADKAAQLRRQAPPPEEALADPGQDCEGVPGC